MRKLCTLCEIEPLPAHRRMRCDYCQRLIEQAANTATTVARNRIPAPVAEIAIKDSIGLSRRIHNSSELAFACHYSHIPLVFDKSISYQGDYVSFDHVVPNDSSRAVLCSRIMNDIKGWMTEVEFRKFIVDFAETNARRRIHGLDFPKTQRFLELLRDIMSTPVGQSAQSVQMLKSLSAQIHYRRKSTLIAE